MKDQLKAGVVLSYVSTALNIIIQLCYMPVMIRLLGQSEYGLYTLVSGIVSYLSLFSLGFGGSYLRFSARYKAKQDEKGLSELNGMFITLFFVLAAAALICGMILCQFSRQVFGDKLSVAELNKAQLMMAILVVGISVTLVNSIFDAIITSYEQFVYQRILNIISNVANPFICLPLLIAGKGSVALVIVTASISVFSLCMNIWFCICKLKVKISFHHFHFGVLKEISSFSFFLLLNMVIDQINWNVDKLILSHTSGTNEVAVYGVASQINSLVLTFSTTISSVFSPRVNRIAAEDEINCTEAFSSLMIRIGRIQWMVLGLVISGFIIFGDFFIVRIFAGPEYKKAYTVALFLIIPAVVPLIQNVGIEIQRALNRHQFRSAIYFFMALINVCVSIPLAEQFGAVGTAMGTAFSLIVANGLIMNIFYYKALHLDMISFWKSIIKCSKGLLIPAIAGGLIMKYIHFQGIGSYLVGIVIYTIVYCVSICLLGCNTQEKRMIKNLIGGRKFRK